ncbi:hypothetical protein B0H13DRAFT_1880774 [Mycena leptocephala]|nr:hypothetical protein B0H13DRAFT_1880774 [Mycena leptocephala]
MAPQPTLTEIRLNNIITCLTLAITTLDELQDVFATPFLGVISSAAVSLVTALEVEINASVTFSIDYMQKAAEKQQQELLELITTLSDDRVSSVQNFNREQVELAKTSLAKAVLHHPDVATKYECRLFIGSEHVTTSIELAALIAAHLGLKPGNDLTKPVLSHLSKGPHCLLVLDNLETSWEPMNSRSNIEHFISLVADIPHLILIITMRGAERPAKVHWTRPFLTL